MTNPLQGTVDSAMVQAEEARATVDKIKTETLGAIDSAKADAQGKIDSVTAAGQAKLNQAENMAKAAEALAISKVNEVQGKVDNIMKALEKPKLPEIPKLPKIPSIPQLPQLPAIPPIPNLDFSVPSPSSILRKLLPKVKIPSFKFKIEVPKFHIHRPDWKGPAKIQPPKLPPGIG